MFGLVRPYYKKMLAQEKCEYKCYYCGLCMGLGRNSGLLSRNLITYDICLAYLLADSISFDAEKKVARCPYAIWRKVTYWDNPKLLDKLAQIDYLLAYHKVLDDIYDDNSFKAKVIERLMRKKYNDIANVAPHLDVPIKEGMEHVRTAEARNCHVGIKEAAEPFGTLLENTMSGCLDDPTDDRIFASLCKHLGMWIYVIDACLDLKKDIKHNKYNPLSAGYDNVSVDDIISQRKEEITVFLMTCKQNMQQLLELFACGKNEHLLQNMFEYLLPQNVADLLR